MAAAEDVRAFGGLLWAVVGLVAVIGVLVLVLGRRLSRVDVKLGRSSATVEAVHEQLTEPTEGRGVTTTRGQLESLRAETAAGFAAATAAQRGTDARIDRVETRLDHVETRLNQIAPKETQ